MNVKLLENSHMQKLGILESRSIKFNGADSKWDLLKINDNRIANNSQKCMVNCFRFGTFLWITYTFSDVADADADADKRKF